MTGREMLELAAMAAALPEWGWMGSGIAYVKDNTFVFWDPHDDDGDALRLANRLRMRIEHHIRRPFVAVFAAMGSDTMKAEEPHGDDADAATRLAILRAAAEIGKAML